MFRFSFIRIIACFFFFINISQYLHAQYDLQSDPDISWIGEFTTDHSFSLNASSKEEIIKLFKLIDQTTTINNANQSNWVTGWITQNIAAEKYNCFKDQGFTQRLSTKEFEDLVYSVDTITTFDPETYKESVRIVKHSDLAQSVSHFRTKQVIYYNKRTSGFQTQLIGIAPIIKKRNAQDLKSNNNPLFWIEMGQAFTSDFDLQSPDINWAALVYSKKSPLEIETIRVLKDDNKINFKDFIYEQVLSSRKPTELEYGSQQLLSKQEVGYFYNSIDTITTFNPETFEETIMIIKNQLNPSEISNYRLVQEWYYDQKTNNLLNRLKAIVPVVDIHSEDGQYRFSKPLYYIRYD